MLSLPSPSLLSPPVVISQNGVGFYRPAVGQPLTVGMLVPAGTNATVVMDNVRAITAK